jgi:hypothetical protein
MSERHVHLIPKDVEVELELKMKPAEASVQVIATTRLRLDGWLKMEHILQITFEAR